MTRTRVAVLGGNRIPFARANKHYARASNQDMLTAALDGLVARYGLQDARLGLVAAGAVLKHSRDFNLTRESVLGSALAPETPALDVQQACATSLTAAVTVADAIAAGRIEAGIAGGTDSASDAPLALNDSLRRTLLALTRARSVPERLKLVGSLRPDQLAPEQPRNAEPRTGLSMGEHAARDTNTEALAKLKPVFGKEQDEPTMTAGNSTALTDGASCALLGTEEFAAAYRLEPLAYLVDSETAAVDFVHGAEGLLMAPTHAVPRLLARQGLTLQDFDLYEIHEAFASQVLATLSAWESDGYCRDVLGLPGALGGIDKQRLNVHGSSLATGHPFAATGTRILATAAKALHQRGGGRALISICAAGGQGVAAILEA